jgi:hypothetical protein
LEWPEASKPAAITPVATGKYLGTIAYCGTLEGDAANECIVRKSQFPPGFVFHGTEVPGCETPKGQVATDCILHRQPK